MNRQSNNLHGWKRQNCSHWKECPYWSVDKVQLGKSPVTLTWNLYHIQSIFNTTKFSENIFKFKHSHNPWIDTLSFSCSLFAKYFPSNVSPKFSSQLFGSKIWVQLTNLVLVIVVKKPFLDGHFQLFIMCVQIGRTVIFIVILMKLSHLKAKIISSCSTSILIFSETVLFSSRIFMRALTLNSARYRLIFSLAAPRSILTIPGECRTLRQDL